MRCSNLQSHTPFKLTVLAAAACFAGCSPETVVVTNIRPAPALPMLQAGLAPDRRASSDSVPTPLAESTRRMAERLAQLRVADPPSRFDSPRQVQRLRAQLDALPNHSDRTQPTVELARELLKAGEPEASLATVLPLLANLGQLPPERARQLDRIVREWEGLCHLRIAERDNCIHHHGVESCLVPIKGTGVHSDQRGARAAIACFDRLLTDYPDDAGFLWLRNIAAMTVGEYPDGVPVAHRVSPAVFASDYDIGRFRDVAASAGLGRRGHAGGSIIEDLDGDGDLDVVASGWLLDDALEVYRNEGDGTFTNQTAAAGVTGLNGGLNIVHADYDNDGDPDILVLRGAWLGPAGRQPNSLLRNLGNLRFEDVTEAAGILTYRPTQVGTWADYDNDGWLDLFIGNEADDLDAHPSELWHNNHDGTFTDRIDLLGDPVLGFVKGASWGDYDNDGRVDLAVVGQGMLPRLYHNLGPGAGQREWRFDDIATELGVIAPRLAFPVWFWDYDNDGLLDLLIAGYSPVALREVAKLQLGLAHANAVPSLYRNTGDGFEDVSSAARVDRVAMTMGANFGDLDNDGWLDFYAGTGAPNLEILIPNRMFRNDRGTTFQDVTTAGGFGHIQKGHGVSFADIDDDGGQDVFEVMGGAYPADLAHNTLYENPGHGNHWLKLRLEGRRANRGAIGARVRVRVSTPSGGRDIFSTVTTGGSFGASPLRREIGLGDATRIESVAIRWPGETTEIVHHGAELDQYYLAVEGERLEPRSLLPVRLGGSETAR